MKPGTEVDVAPGFSGGLVAEYYLTGGFALDVIWAYTLLNDDPVEAAGVELIGEPARAGAHSQLLDLLVGVSYTF